MYGITEARNLLERILLHLRRPWIGTGLLVILGTISAIFPFTLFYGVQFVLISAAALVALRLYGGIYGFVSLALIYLLKSLTVGLIHIIFMSWQDILLN